MSRETRRAAFGKLLLRLILVVLLVGLALVAAACEQLSTDAPMTAPAETSMTATTVTQPASAESVYGTWEGNYTVLAVWDRSGTVNNPPVPLGTPLAMQLVLHPLSGAGGDYGTVDVPGFGSSRVTGILEEGASVQLSVVSEASGRGDTHSVFTLSLEEDTLTGEDSGDPAVPSGWVTTSGTIALTRTGPWSAAGAAGESAGASGGGAGLGGGAGTEDSITEMSLLLGTLIAMTTTTEPTGQTFYLDEDDDGHTVGMHRGDRIRVDLHPAAEEAVYDIFFQVSNAIPLEYVHEGVERTSANRIVHRWVEYEATWTGQVTLSARYAYGGFSSVDWSVYVHVVE